MRLTNNTRLKNLEKKLNCSLEKKPLSILYMEKKGLLYIMQVSCKINVFFKWNKVLLLIPDNGRRLGEMQNFCLTSEYVKKQPEIAQLLRDIAQEKDLELAIDIPYPKSGFDEE